MAKVKGYNPPETEFMYDDATGDRHYFGEPLRMVLGDGHIDPRDLETDIVGKSRRGARPSQQGEGSVDQHKYRTAFSRCTILWNSLPEECPEPVPDPPPTSKKSIWNTKLEHGVVCSYYDLFMRCCLQFTLSHGGELPDGDCFPCTPVEACEGVSIEFETQTMKPGEQQELSVDGAVFGFDYKWKIISGPGTLGGSNSTARALATLIDVGETEIDKINIAEAWIEANKSESTTPIINPISEVEHDAYILLIDNMLFYFDAVFPPIIAAVMAYAYDDLVSPALKGYLYAIQMVEEEHPRAPFAIASYKNALMTVWGGAETDAGVIAHEAAHGLALATWGGFAPGEGSHYMAAIDSDEPPVSEYGKSSNYEDFAEAIYLYTEDPEELLAIAPLRYAAIEALLSGDIFYGYPAIYFAPKNTPPCYNEIATVALNSGKNMCDQLEITVADPPGDVLAWDYEASEEEIERNNQAEIIIVGGKGPFLWSVSGTGFSLESTETEGRSNTLYADETACGSAAITVIDLCDETITGFVRGDIGQWVLKGNYCGMPGEEGLVINYDHFWYHVEAIKGNKKQRENHTSSGVEGMAGCEDTYATCAELIAEHCSDEYPCLVFDSPCEDIYAPYPIECKKINCRRECTRVWDAGKDCWWTYFRWMPYNTNYYYYEWEC